MQQTRRTEQVGELIKHELAYMILREIDFPTDVLVTVVKVDVTTDMRQAFVGVSVLPFGKSVSTLQRLQKSARTLQKLLISKLVMKFVPKLTFTLDKTEEEASKIETLLAEIRDKGTHE